MVTSAFFRPVVALQPSIHAGFVFRIIFRPTLVFTVDHVYLARHRSCKGQIRPKGGGAKSPVYGLMLRQRDCHLRIAYYESASIKSLNKVML